jgi:hypothetical protein
MSEIFNARTEEDSQKPDFLAEGIPVSYIDSFSPEELDRERLRIRRELIRTSPIA